MTWADKSCCGKTLRIQCSDEISLTPIQRRHRRDRRQDRVRCLEEGRPGHVPPHHTKRKSAATRWDAESLNPALLENLDQLSRAVRTSFNRSTGRLTPKRSASIRRSSRAISLNLPFTLIRCW